MPIGIRSVLMWGLFTFFIISGAVIGFIQNELNSDITTNSRTAAQTVEDSEVELQITNPISSAATIGNIFKNIALMFVWTGAVPLLFELVFFLPLRLMFYYIVADTLLPG